MKTQNKNKIKQYEDKYIHIKKTNLRLIWCIPLTIILFLFAYLNLRYGIISNWNYLGLNELFNKDIYSPQNLLIIPMLFFEYLLISISFISLVYTIKGRVKSYKEEGLIFGLILFLIMFLFLGVFMGLISGLIFGLILALIIALISGLISGLIFGLIWEFQE